ncbi:MAG TPA: ribosome maturation factor RimM [Mycobacteriales bacterium]|nr:ribosome maturation factor RimM [Mycobacteriales bacterium]
MDLVVGRIGHAHGIKGEVSVEVRTDDPDRRYAAGSVLATDPPERGPLTVVGTRAHHGRLLVRFDGINDRNAAEALRGTLLVVDSASVGETEPDEWWDHDLVGLRAVTKGGVDLGAVADVVHVPGPPLLSIVDGDGREVLVPFVAAIVPEVDVPGGRLVVDPPPGLLDLAEE